ncbi:MAG: L-histidine N(alpha)-methyltransferase [Alphaproteobacteria bacterium]
MDKSILETSERDTNVTALDVNTPRFFLDYHPPKDDFSGDVLKGLAMAQKQVPAKYLYDARGSDLFEQICCTPEYYVTRTELKMLSSIGSDIARVAGRDVTVIEFGSGSDAKIRRLLDSLPSPRAYVAIDISRAPLQRAVKNLSRDYPGLIVGGVIADFTKPLRLPTEALLGKKLAFFPGSTIGNLDRDLASQFLNNMRTMLSLGDGFLIGVDLPKDPNLLNLAYNDRKGVTAEFNLNLLRRINRELNGTIDEKKFCHFAFYNKHESRVEMHLRSTTDQHFIVADTKFSMKRSETIHTENSNKYTVSEFLRIAEDAAFDVLRTWTDGNSLFSIHYLVAT